MTRSADVVTQPEPPIVHRDSKPENSSESPWTREDELHAEGIANAAGG